MLLMNTNENKINDYISNQSESKRADLNVLHQMVLNQNPKLKLWFLDGKDEEGKIISNPNIGYGTHLIEYKNGTSKEFYKIGISTNTTGISIYVFGIEDKNFLKDTFGSKLGQAKITSYCIKFKNLKAIDFEVLKEIIQVGLNQKE